MSEFPILFKGPLVCAILGGQKTVTRRPVKNTGLYAIDAAIHGEETARRELAALATRCPYGQPGDRLWVRETTTEEVLGSGSVTRYVADDALSPQEWWYSRRSCPSIHMPRFACRLLLEVTAVRVERLQDIDEGQAQAEGIMDHELGCSRPVELDGYPACDCGSISYIESFQRLWESTGGDWDANPFVWVIDFKQVPACP